jgi:hypothetical protein
MTFTIDIDGVSLSQADHNSNDKIFYLRSIYQSNLPLNDVFYLKIKGIWRNTQNSGDYFEYYLIYACRFVSKLILSLSPSSSTILKG